MLFTREDPISVGIMIYCLSHFGDMLGLKMNVDKSNMCIARVHGQELDDILASTNILMGSTSFRYLGVPLATKILKIRYYNSFINKVTTYIGAGSRASLSCMGRAKFVRFVLQGVKCFGCLSLHSSHGCLKSY